LRLNRVIPPTDAILVHAGYRETVRRSAITDWAVALVLAAFAQLEIWYPRAAVGVGEVTGQKAVLVPTALAMTLPVAVRRSRPLGAAVVVMGAAALQAALTTPTQGLSGIVAGLLTLYSAGMYCDTAQAAIAGAVTFAAVVAGSSGAGDVAFGALIFGSALGVGMAMRRRHEHTEQLTRERDQAVGTERARIARELHDVIAHGVTTMVVQAQAGSTLLASDPDRTRDALQSIEEAGRQALVELRRLLGLLRTPDADDLAPQPQMVQLDALIDGFRQSGLSVHVTTHGDPRSLPAGVDLTTYRVIQEALTNALKHAPAADVDVTVRYLDRRVDVRIENDVSAGGGGGNGGHGLIGMHERIALYGGELAAGAQDGRFLVHASLPFAP
jgi:signal transduction histidine kinase